MTQERTIFRARPEDYPSTIIDYFNAIFYFSPEEACADELIEELWTEGFERMCGASVETGEVAARGCHNAAASDMGIRPAGQCRGRSEG